MGLRNTEWKRRERRSVVAILDGDWREFIRDTLEKELSGAYERKTMWSRDIKAPDLDYYLEIVNHFLAPT